MKSLKERMAVAMQRRPDLSQADIARECGVKPPSVFAWINGDTKSLGPEPARRAGLLFGCDQNWIGQGRGQPNWRDPPPVGLAAATPAATVGPDLPQALERLGIALAAEMPDDVRDDVADALAKLARRRGSGRDQEQVLTLLANPGAAPGKRQAAG